MADPKTLLERQRETDESGGLVERLKRYFEKPDGLFHWPDYGITRVSAVVIGQRFFPGPPGEKDRVEVVWSISIDSKFAIPHFGQGKSFGDEKGRFTFVQTANSVFTHSFVSGATGNYVGDEPPTKPGS
jgi:hypothetical protein